MSGNDALRFVRNCTVPWRSLDAYYTSSQRDFVGADTQEQIIKCFNCEKPECDNCLSSNYTGGIRAIRQREAKELFLYYYYKGYTVKRICEEMHISAKTYNRYRKKFVLGEE